MNHCVASCVVQFVMRIINMAGDVALHSIKTIE